MPTISLSPESGKATSESSFEGGVMLDLEGRSAQ